MPYKSKKGCAFQGCNKLVSGRNKFCVEHNKTFQKNYDNNFRNNNSKKLYQSTIWRKIRKIILQEKPLCEECTKNGHITPATEIDHIEPFREDYSKFIDMQNLQSLCKSCHSKKTLKETFTH